MKPIPRPRYTAFSMDSGTLSLSRSEKQDWLLQSHSAVAPARDRREEEHEGRGGIGDPFSRISLTDPF